MIRLGSFLFVRYMASESLLNAAGTIVMKLFRNDPYYIGNNESIDL